MLLKVDAVLCSSQIFFGVERGNEFKYIQKIYNLFILEKEERILIRVVAHKERLLGGTFSATVFAERGLAVGLSTLHKSLLGSGDVVLLTLPGLQATGLQSTSETESKSPRSLHVVVVHGVQVETGILLAQSTRQELRGED